MYNNRAGIKAYNDLLELITEARIKISHADRLEQLEIIKEVYLKCKEYALIIYGCGKKSYYLTNILDALYYCEIYLENQYITDQKEQYQNPGKSIIPDNELDIIVNNVRHRIVNEHVRKKHILYVPNDTLDEIDLTDTCEEVSRWVEEECKVKNIKSSIVRIDPGFNAKKPLYNHTGFHYFNLVYLDNKVYFFDLTYKQFFKQNKNTLSRIGVVGLSGCLPGIYMMIDDERKELANTIIEKGYAEFNEKNIKDYFDGFALSVRNGTYYELLGRVDYHTHYSSEDYLKFLSKQDDMFKHEPREGLGLQLKPLKNPHLNFETK